MTESVVIVEDVFEQCVQCLHRRHKAPFLFNIIAMYLEYLGGVEVVTFSDVVVGYGSAVRWTDVVVLTRGLVGVLVLIILLRTLYVGCYNLRLFPFHLTCRQNY